MVLNWRSQWAIEPCELHRVYPPLADDPGTGNGTEERGVTGGEPALAEATTRATLAGVPSLNRSTASLGYLRECPTNDRGRRGQANSVATAI
jgi:hypothetical protein